MGEEECTNHYKVRRVMPEVGKYSVPIYGKERIVDYFYNFRTGEIAMLIWTGQSDD